MNNTERLSSSKDETVAFTDPVPLPIPVLSLSILPQRFQFLFWVWPFCLNSSSSSSSSCSSPESGHSALTVPVPVQSLAIQPYCIHSTYSAHRTHCIHCVLEGDKLISEWFSFSGKFRGLFISGSFNFKVFRAWVFHLGYYSLRTILQICMPHLTEYYI